MSMRKSPATGGKQNAYGPMIRLLAKLQEIQGGVPMKKRIQKKLELSRETLRSLAGTGLREVAGGGSNSCPMACGSDANTVCFATCACNSTVC
jgi:hypothetical protein